jgi:hypothetical protein
MKYDVFICHASEDKDGVARPLAEALQKEGVQVWYDEFNLRVGDSLSHSIDVGLAQSRFGVVIVSRRFLEKPWPQRELHGLISRELTSGAKVILPVWHEISKEDLVAVSPTLADVLATSTTRGMDHVVEQILEVVRPDPRHSTRLGGLAGEYLVTGFNATGKQYRGRAAIREHDGILVIASTIGARTYVCQGRLANNKLTVYGDFDVEYTVKEDGSLIGTWGNGGHETLTPTEVPSGPKDPPSKGEDD